MPRTALTGSHIRARRTVLGLSQAALARRVGISASYLNLIEHNRRRVGGGLLVGIAEALGVSAASLREGAEAGLMEALREAAASVPADVPVPPEADRAEEFVGRFPGWAALSAAQARRLGALERSVERLTDRMTHDPHLSAALHELLSVAAALRSTATILAETDDLSAEWQARFLTNLERDSQRLAEGAQALVGYLDAAAPEESGLAAPQEEMEAWLDGRGWHLPELEGDDPDAVAAVLAGTSALASASARSLARAHLDRARADAKALPLGRMRAAVAAHGADPAALAQALDLAGDLPRLFRRLAALPEGFAGLPPLGLVVCDGSGTLTYRRPVPGFGLPRFGAACPLWPLFQAVSRPLQPLRMTVETAGRLPQRFEAFAVCQPVVPAGFGWPAVLEASMLILPARAEDVAGAGAVPALPVGTSCRICPRPQCPARREPALVA
ncbi:MAG: short-chain fatty acyl-CoA regulator family protein [Alkalilacustris sp.]